MYKGNSSKGFSQCSHWIKLQSIEKLKILVKQSQQKSCAKIGKVALFSEIDPMYSGAFIESFSESQKATCVILGLDHGLQSWISKLMHGPANDYIRKHSPVPVLDPLENGGQKVTQPSPVVLSVPAPSSIIAN